MSEQEKQDKQDKQKSGLKDVVAKMSLYQPDARTWSSWIKVPMKQTVCRKDDFEPYTEAFRPLNEAEIIACQRIDGIKGSHYNYPALLVSYQALPGGFTICNVLINSRLYSGCSHCIKSDRWLPIRGKMQAFRRAIEQSEGVELSKRERTR